LSLPIQAGRAKQKTKNNRKQRYGNTHIVFG
jgi:hypothetical protein